MEADISVSFGRGEGCAWPCKRTDRRTMSSLEAKSRVAARAVKTATVSLGKSSSERGKVMMKGLPAGPGGEKSGAALIGPVLPPRVEAGRLTLL